MEQLPEDDPLGALYRRVGPAAYRLALLVTGDPATAEDVVQAAFVRVLERRDRLERPDELDGYLLRTARNLAHDQQRRAQRHERATDALRLVAPRAESPGEGPDAEAITRALGALPLEQREVVYLRVFEGLTFPAVAERTEAPLPTVHSRYRYGMERLRALLGTHHER